MSVIIGIGAILLICWASSTRESRAEARASIKPYEPMLWKIAFALWGLIALMVLIGPPNG